MFFVAQMCMDFGNGIGLLKRSYWAGLVGSGRYYHRDKRRLWGLPLGWWWKRKGRGKEG